jgi:hypothetical protein
MRAYPSQPLLQTKLCLKELPVRFTGWLVPNSARSDRFDHRHLSTDVRRTYNLSAHGLERRGVVCHVPIPILTLRTICKNRHMRCFPLPRFSFAGLRHCLLSHSQNQSLICSANAKDYRCNRARGIKIIFKSFPPKLKYDSPDSHSLLVFISFVFDRSILMRDFLESLHVTPLQPQTCNQPKTPEILIRASHLLDTAFLSQHCGLPCSASSRLRTWPNLSWRHQVAVS